MDFMVVFTFYSFTEGQRVHVTNWISGWLSKKKRKKKKGKKERKKENTTAKRNVPHP